MKKLFLLIALLLASVSYGQGTWGGLTATAGNNFLSPYTGTYQGSVISPLYGGTGVNGNTATNGFILIGNGSGYTLAAITGTSNQVVVTNGSGTITLSLPQSIATASTPQFLRLGLNQAADATASLAATQTALHTTSTDGIILQNTTAALVGQTQEYSPRLVLLGAAWKSNATAASETDKWAIENEPQTGAAATTQNLVFQSSLAGGAYATKATLTSGAVLNLITGGSYQINATDVLNGTTLGTGVTASSLTSFGTSPTIVTPSITTGFTIGGSAATGTFPRGNGTNFIASTLTIPNTSTTGDIFVSTGTSAMGVVAVNATANKVLMSGASAVPTWSTPTFPNASATSRKKIVSDGTNWVASTETWAVPGTANNVLTSDGTNWISSAPASGGLTYTAITADQTAAVGTIYINNKSGSILSITIPATGTVGQQFGVIGGSNTASFKFVYTTNQKLHIGATTSTVTSGNVTMTEQWAAIIFTCIVTNNEWVATYYTGTATAN